ncbi:aromatic-ring-hydroxylating dioxygenase subunit beta [Bordetella genomosp. 9]|uniref:Ring-hydroxylating dioxygenase subunit beta n=1 Tax=Bordetella genomosp. 9 TaxID=1416803 RepID=A0A1W6Z085_9BORD|nr:aromatic-ring-hydroxylating dioxygenase subunit beta [Bordetella genomosp. 9]ARP86777.1 ring-hydroxylating dioxygenase subunit beta [Bordetella genomosp. 9]
MKTDFAYVARRIDPARAALLRQEIEEFHADYCAVLDANLIESWPGFFTDDAVYRITSRENAERGLPVGLVYAEGRDMMQDRAVAIARTQMFAPRYMRHLVTNTRVLCESDSGIESQSSFLLMQTLVEGPTTLHLAGYYHDVFTRAGTALKLKERQVVYDTEILANDLVYPV